MELSQEFHFMLLICTAVLDFSPSGADPLLLFVDQKNLRSYDLDSGNTSIQVSSGFFYAWGLDFHHGNQKVYVSDTFRDKIYEVNMSTTPPTLDVLLDSGLSSPRGIAVDWINNNLYWIDRGNFFCF